MKGLARGFEGRLDGIFQDAVENRAFSIPGLVAMARRGSCIYGPKGFGHLNAKAGRPMPANAMMRIYSMSKVLTCAVALMLYERRLFKLSDPVSKYIPSFRREWSVVRQADSIKTAPERIEVINLSSGRRSDVGFVREPAHQEMRISHLLTETSGIGYDVWGDLDEDLNHVLGTGRSFQIANALRAKQYRTLYSSACILGHDLSLEEFCDALANVGVLATEPGTFSYGLGAAVLSRVVEVIYSHWTGVVLPLSGIFARMLFEPLEMNTAAFFLQDGDPRADLMPSLYGVKEDDEGVHIVPAATSVPPGALPYSNGTDHVSGPRKFESGDAGAIMTVEDYARFLDFLARGGVTEKGERLLSPGGVAMLTAGRISGLKLDTPLARLLGCAGQANEGPEGSFQFGWRVSHAGGWRDDYDGSYHPGLCNWSGYAHTTVSYYRGDDAWLIIAPQLMAHGPTGSDRINDVLTAPATRAFLDLWR